MMDKGKTNRQLKSLGKIVEYILRRHPEEFGLFLNDDGSLPLRELLWALHEEPEWRYVRASHFRELACAGIDLAFSVDEKLIRAKIPPGPPPRVLTPPPLLFYGARRKAYSVILKEGLKAAGRPYVPLATTEEMALRIGRRRDAKPVLLTVQAGRAQQSGYPFLGSGELLYLAKVVPAEFISGPPLRHIVQARKAAARKATGKQPAASLRLAGSFLFDPARELESRGRKVRRQHPRRPRRKDRQRGRKDGGPFRKE